MGRRLRLLTFLVLPIVAAAEEPVDLVKALEEAPSPETYHAMCSAAYALRAARANDNRPLQAQLDTYTVEHGKKTENAAAMTFADIFETLLDEGRIEFGDLKRLTDKCEL